MKRIIAFIISAMLIISASLGAGALFDSGDVTKNLRSSVYYMENLDEGTVFFEKDSDKKVAMAGFSKLISAVVALEKWGNLDGEITVTKEGLGFVKYGFGVRTALYKEGETVSKKELFDCLVLYSANDVVSLIAHDICSSAEEFISLMQELCDKIGCSSTVIKNMTGFDAEGQYTTARDVAKIIKYAYQYPLFVEAFNLSSVTLKATELNEERTYNSSNRMMNAGISDYYHSSVTGGKQTSTDEAGQCIVTISNKDGYSYLTIVMGGLLTNIDSDTIEENTSMTDARQMLEWVYDNIRYRTVVSPTETVITVDIAAGKDTDVLRLVPESEVSALVPEGASPESVLCELAEGSLPEKIYAPVKAGEVMAQAKIYYAHQEIATVNLVAANTVKLSVTSLIMNWISGILSSRIFILIVAILTVAAIGLFLYNLLDYRKKAQEMEIAFRKRLAARQKSKNKSDKK